MKNCILILKILLPVAICLILIGIIKIPFSYYPLSFGLVIGLANWNSHKYNLLLGVLLSIFVSHIAFYLAYFSFAITINIFSFMKGDTGNILGLTVSAYVIAPLLVFMLYRFVFNIPKTNLTIVTILLSIFLVVLQSYFFYLYEFNQKSVNSFIGWQAIMALALQLILYQNELKALFKPKNE